MKSKLLMAALLLPGLVQAHATLEKTEAESGSYYKGVVGISHGCDGSATTKVTIEIPDGVRGVKPVPKAGWQLDIVKAPLAKPYESHGKTVVEDVSKITWYGNSLAHAHYDEFVFRGQIAVGNSSKLYFPVRQECVVGELNWDQTPESMKKANDPHASHADHAGPYKAKADNEHAGHAGHAGMKLDYP
ncbi:MAG: YcnI family protein, partial [Methylophaga sp.]